MGISDQVDTELDGPLARRLPVGEGVDELPVDGCHGPLAHHCSSDVIGAEQPTRIPSEAGVRARAQGRIHATPVGDPGSTVGCVAMKADDLRREALALSDGERAALAADLLASLDEPAGEDAETVRLAWAQEIERRAVTAITGESQTEPWESVRQRIADDLSG